MIDVEAVKAGLRTTAVLDHFGARYRDEPQIRLRECPRCGAKTQREAVAIDRDSGAWVHHSGASAADASCKGDLLELVAAFAGLDRKTELPKLLEVAAPIAGVSADTTSAEVDRIVEQRRREQAAYERERAERRAATAARVPDQWEALAKRSLVGERYLARRGLDTAELVARDVVRFGRDGDPCVRLHDFETGAPINILCRQIEGEPKVRSLPDCTTDGTIVGRIGELDRQGPDVAVLVEGATDALAAVLAFPGCVVVGANGAGKMTSVAAHVAPALAAIGGWLLLVADDDDTGISHAAAALNAAIDGGLALERDLHIVELGAHHDLLEAYAAGWRWTWPSPRTA